MKKMMFLLPLICLACERRMPHSGIPLPEVRIQAPGHNPDLHYRFLCDSLCMDLDIADLSDKYLRFSLLRRQPNLGRSDSVKGYAVGYPQSDPEIAGGESENAYPCVLYEAFGEYPIQFCLNLLDSSTIRLRCGTASDADFELHKIE